MARGVVPKPRSRSPVAARVQPTRVGEAQIFENPLTRKVVEKEVDKTANEIRLIEQKIAKVQGNPDYSETIGRIRTLIQEGNIKAAKTLARNAIIAGGETIEGGESESVWGLFSW